MIVIICWLSNFKDRASPIFHRAKQCCVDFNDELLQRFTYLQSTPLGLMLEKSGSWSLTRENRLWEFNFSEHLWSVLGFVLVIEGIISWIPYLASFHHVSLLWWIPSGTVSLIKLFDKSLFVTVFYHSNWEVTNTDGTAYMLSTSSLFLLFSMGVCLPNMELF